MKVNEEEANREGSHCLIVLENRTRETVPRPLFARIWFVSR